MTGQALWITGQGRAELRAVAASAHDDGMIQARALVSGISRGTERLVFHGRVPPGERERMRCPFQEGTFPYPVKYGYAMVARVENGPAALAGRRVFSLFPHQSVFQAPEEAAIPIPRTVSTARAALAPQVETALNATWDAGVKPGQSIAVVGAGVIGLLVGWLCARKAQVTIIDINPARAQTAAALGLAFATPQEAPRDCDLVFHTSATDEGLNLSLSLARFEGSVIELSWFGDKRPNVDLGAAFHSQRLTLRASQVGAVAPSHRKGWSHRRRLARALSLCADPRLDALVAAETPFRDIAARYGDILADPNTLCHLIRYPEP